MANRTQAAENTVLTDAIIRQAENWHRQVSAGEPTAALKAEFQAWYEEHSSHQQAYAQVFMCHDAGVALRVEERKAANDNKRPLAVIGAIAACLMLMVFGAGFYGTAPEFTDYATATAEVQNVGLEDGTTITLGAASRIKVGDFSRDTRQVVLQEGEVLFDVAHNAEKPFLVTSGDTTVQVLGTKFTVNRAPGYISVALIEGKVNVRHITEPSALPFLEKAETVVLEPAQSITVTAGILSQPKTQNVEQMINWIDGTRSYFDTPLSRIVADINRYSVKPVHIASAETGNIPVTLVFGMDQIDSVLQSLPQIVPVTVDTMSDAIIIRAAP